MRGRQHQHRPSGGRAGRRALKAQRQAVHPDAAPAPRPAALPVSDGLQVMARPPPTTVLRMVPHWQDAALREWSHILSLGPQHSLCLRSQAKCLPPAPQVHRQSGGAPLPPALLEVPLIARCHSETRAESETPDLLSFKQNSSMSSHTYRTAIARSSHFPATPATTDFTSREKERGPDPAVSWGAEPVTQQRTMLCIPLGDDKPFHSSLTVLLGVQFLIRKILEMRSSR